MVARPKVEIHDGELPSAQLIRQAVAEVEVTDARGRTIKLRKPGVLAQYQLVKAIGAESAANSTLVQMYLPVLYVAAIDGDAVFLPKSEMEVEALISRLDEDGLVAVMQGVEKHFSGGATAESRNAAMEADRDETRK